MINLVVLFVYLVLGLLKYWIALWLDNTKHSSYDFNQVIKKGGLYGDKEKKKITPTHKSRNSQKIR